MVFLNWAIDQISTLKVTDTCGFTVLPRCSWQILSLVSEELVQCWERKCSLQRDRMWCPFQWLAQSYRPPLLDTPSSSDYSVWAKEHCRKSSLTQDPGSDQDISGGMDSCCACPRFHWGWLWSVTTLFFTCQKVCWWQCGYRCGCQTEVSTTVWFVFIGKKRWNKM